MTFQTFKSLGGATLKEILSIYFRFSFAFARQNIRTSNENTFKPREFQIDDKAIEHKNETSICLWNFEKR